MALSPSEERRLLELERKEYRDNCRKDVIKFTEHTYGNYETNWHHQRLGSYLNDWVFGDLENLIVSMGPQNGKSELCSRRLPPFIFGNMPDSPIITASYSASLSSKMNRDTQNIIDSKEYRELFPHVQLYGKNVRTVDRPLRNSEEYEIVGHGGAYRCAGVGGGLTGMPARYGIIDDPFKDYAEAHSPTIRQKVWDWYCTVFDSRLSKDIKDPNAEDGKTLIIMTRWHEDDLVGRLLEIAKSNPDAKQWELVSFPTILEQETEGDPREVGDVIWPAKHPKKKILRVKATWGPYKFNALHQQNPTPPEGTIVQRKWLKYYLRRDTPDRFDEIVQSWDFAEGGESGDYTVCQIWGKVGADKYLLDQYRDRLETPESIELVETVTETWPTAYVKLMEKKSTGVSVIQACQRKIPGIIAVNPTDSKLFRLKGCSGDFHSGNVFYPNPKESPWVFETIEELVGFGSAKNDDTVDTTTQALLRWQEDLSGDMDEDMIPEENTIAGGLEAGVQY